MKVLSKISNKAPYHWKLNYSGKHNKATVILGAGASKILGFPTQLNLWRYLRSHSTKHGRSHLDYIRKYYGDDIEKSFTHIMLSAKDSAPEDYLESPLVHLKSVISDAFKRHRLDRKGVRIYREFIQGLIELFPGVEFISLNWDNALEQILESLGQKVNYHFLFDKSFQSEFSLVDNGVSVLKIHGSVNWHFCHHCKRLICDNSVPISEYLVQVKVHKESEKQSYILLDSVIDSAKNRLPKTFGDDPIEIGLTSFHRCPVCKQPALECILTPPSHLKPAGFDYLDSIKRACFQCLSSSGTLILVGCGWREVDYDLSHLIHTAALGSGWIKLYIVNDLKTAKRNLKFFKRTTGPRLECTAIHLGYLNQSTLHELRHALSVR